MRLSDIPGRGDAPLPAEVEAELDALDAALRGEEVPPGMEELAALAADVSAERVEPESEFGAELDAWAAAGFPRGRRPGAEAAAGEGGGREGVRRLQAWLTPRRMMPVAAAASVLVVAVVAISQVDRLGDDSGSNGGSDTTVTAQEDAGQAEEVAPTPESLPEQAGDGADLREGRPLTDDLDRAFDRNAEEFRATQGADAVRNSLGRRAAAGQDVRRVERDAQLTLAAPADEVQDVTNDAIGVVNVHRGVVLSSRSQGTDDAARATLDLMIPTRNLDVALEDLSDLADVKSLSEGSLDITRPFVDAKDKLAGLRAERRSLLSQIEVADTEEELDQLKVRLDSVQRAIARADAEFDNIKRRAQRSNVSLQVTSEGADEGDWSIEDALDDAGRVLTVGAGVALISGAVLLPLALIAAIAYFVVAAAKRRARERALDE